MLVSSLILWGTLLYWSPFLPHQEGVLRLLGLSCSAWIFLRIFQGGNGSDELMLQEWGIHVCPVHQCGPGIQHRAWHRTDAWGRAVCQKAWREQRPADELPGDSWVSKWLEGMLTQYFPHSPNGKACFENEKAESPPPWLGEAYEQLPPPGNLSVKVQKSGHPSSQVQRREGV